LSIIKILLKPKQCRTIVQHLPDLNALTKMKS